jgi:hypothetical protein
MLVEAIRLMRATPTTADKAGIIRVEIKVALPVAVTPVVMLAPMAELITATMLTTALAC